ncbi:MAG: 2-C-methyl-D-erythritol 4-phosphate cytidylyltransferase [Lachnospiraceae bacterium]|nr:2-C-methyl-D-erythritol 4-phosphate cytidylyltransferase [Lachnospiraceae bacterium]
MVWAAIVAGGTGTRMKSAIPKQFLTVGGETILGRSISVFLASPEVDGIVIGAPAEYIEETGRIAREQCEKLHSKKPVIVTAGGTNRNETLKNLCEAAFDKLGASPEDIFVTHDAVRPFVTERMIAESVHSMETAEVSTVAIPTTDTLLLSPDQKEVEAVPDRSRYYRAQTPQTARLGALSGILNAMSAEERSISTDLCGLFAAKGIRAVIIPGSEKNIKITGPSDLRTAEALLQAENE